MLPIIAISALQKGAGKILDDVTDYAVVQSHGHDRAFVLSPPLGRLLLESGMLETLKTKLKEAHVTSAGSKDSAATGEELRGLIGTVLRELSKR